MRCTTQLPLVVSYSCLLIHWLKSFSVLIVVESVYKVVL
jgi:hypothetical protein